MPTGRSRTQMVIMGWRGEPRPPPPPPPPSASGSLLGPRPLRSQVRLWWGWDPYLRREEGGATSVVAFAADLPTAAELLRPIYPEEEPTPAASASATGTQDNLQTDTLVKL